MGVKTQRDYWKEAHDQVMEEMRMSNFRGPEGKWEPYYTWKPRRINSKWYWLTTVYRREKNKYVYPHSGYEFGDGFDVLKDAC
jgi:hypothetical protein